MNNLDKYYEETNDIKGFAKAYFHYLNELMNNLDVGQIEAFAAEMQAARKEDNTVFIIGNGGSAVTASHMANDFGTDVAKNAKTDKAFKVLSLTDNIAVMLAVANDVGYERLFTDQLQVHYRKGDKLIAISASGNSTNVVRAAKWVRAQGGRVMSFVGFDGGKLKGISDVCIHVKSMKGEYGPVEDIHMVMDHMIAIWLQHSIKERENNETRNSRWEKDSHRTINI